MKKLMQIIKEKIQGRAAHGEKIVSPCGWHTTAKPEKPVGRYEWEQNLQRVDEEIYNKLHRS